MPVDLFDIDTEDDYGQRPKPDFDPEDCGYEMLIVAAILLTMAVSALGLTFFICKCNGN